MSETISKLEKGNEVVFWAYHKSMRTDSGEAGFVKSVNDKGWPWVVFIRAFPEATPDNLDQWTGALCDPSRIVKVNG